jgi:hypothetical protein
VSTVTSSAPFSLASTISNSERKLGQSRTQIRQSLQAWNVRSRSARAAAGSR